MQATAYDAYASAPEAVAFAGDINAAAAAAKDSVKGAGAWEVELYTKKGMRRRTARQQPVAAGMPDPSPRPTWDNYVHGASGPDGTDRQEGHEAPLIGQDRPARGEGDGERCGTGTPVIPVPARPRRASRWRWATAVARTASAWAVPRARATMMAALHRWGQNVYPWTAVVGGTVSYAAVNATVEGTSTTYPLGLTQTQLTDMDRESIVKGDHLREVERP